MPSSPTPSLSFSEQEFRSALSTFATGVTIITTLDAAGAPVGVTANSFNSVSLSPPLVLWSLARRAGSLAAFAAGSHYAINVLSSSQRDLAERFAAKHVDRFAGVAYQAGACGVPILEGAIAVFECFNRSRYDEGDHVIFVGEVQCCKKQTDGLPLIFHGGRYFTELPL